MMMMMMMMMKIMIITIKSQLPTVSHYQYFLLPCSSERVPVKTLKTESVPPTTPSISNSYAINLP